ncbi:MAG: DUF1464 family protein [bacterium]|nr:DUF1464 family protein [bacterium]
MRTVGIDPGTMSFDFFGMDGDRVIIDRSVPSAEVAARPEAILDLLRPLASLDAVVGPSGYGLPLKPISEAGEEDLDLMLPVAHGDVSVNEGIKRVFRLMKAERLPVWLTPGVIHLPTVPSYRKANRLDMGTADKVCCVALGVRDQVRRLGIPAAGASFILVEVGYGFTAVIGVDEGRIVDGIGGTMGGPGFLSPGGMDAELAIRFDRMPQSVLFTGGARDLSGDPGLTPERLAGDPVRHADAWLALVEGIEKDVAAVRVSVRAPREILLSGRLARIPAMAAELSSRLSRHGAVRHVAREAGTAKEAAEGAQIIGEGLLGGRHADIVERLALRESRGTMYDHIKVDVVSNLFPRRKI